MTVVVTLIALLLGVGLLLVGGGKSPASAGTSGEIAEFSLRAAAAAKLLDTTANYLDYQSTAFAGDDLWIVAFAAHKCHNSGEPRVCDALGAASVTVKAVVDEFRIVDATNIPSPHRELLLAYSEPVDESMRLNRHYQVPDPVLLADANGIEGIPVWYGPVGELGFGSTCVASAINIDGSVIWTSEPIDLDPPQTEADRSGWLVTYLSDVRLPLTAIPRIDCHQWRGRGWVPLEHVWTELQPAHDDYFEIDVAMRWDGAPFDHAASKCLASVMTFTGQLATDIDIIPPYSLDHEWPLPVTVHRFRIQNPDPIAIGPYHVMVSCNLMWVDDFESFDDTVGGAT